MLAFSRLDPTPRRKLRIWDFLVHQVTVFTKPGIRYLFDDEFFGTLTAGNVNGTDATPGPGTRTVVDTGDDVSIGSGQIQTAGFTATGDPALVYGDIAITREAGRVMLVRADITDLRYGFGWSSEDATPTNSADMEAFFLDIGSGGPSVRHYLTQIDFQKSYTPTNEYLHAIVLKATGAYFFVKSTSDSTWATWTLCWIANTGTATPLYAAWCGRVVALDPALYFRVPARLWLPTPLCYDSFTRANGAIGSSETTGPDGQAAPAVAWPGGATWTVASNKMVNTPNLGADLLASLNGDFADWTTDDPDIWSVVGEVANDPECSEAATGEAHADTPTLGGGMANLYSTASTDFRVQQNAGLTPGVWYAGSINIDTRTAGTILIDTGNAYFSQSYTSAGIKTWAARAGSAWFKIWTSAVPADVTIDDISFQPLTWAELINIPDHGIANVVAEVEIAVDPATHLAGLAIGWDSQSSPANGIIVYHNGVICRIEKCVAGTWTTVQSTAAAFSANAKLICVRDGSAVSVFYNNAKIGSTVTISDAAIVAGTRHGAFSTNATPTMDNVLIFPRGSGGEYNGALNRYSGARP